MRENRPVQGFTEVELAMMGTLHLTQGATESLTVETEDDLLPKIVTTVRHNRLTIRLAPATRITTRQPIDFFLTMKEITGIALASSVSLQAGPVQSAHLAITVSGSGGGTLDLVNADALALAVSGSGSLTFAQVQTQTLQAAQNGFGGITLAGATTSEAVTISGSGSYHASNFASQGTQVNLSGSGGAQVRASATLIVSVSGSGSVDYWGNPRVTQVVSGSGRVRKVGG